MISEKGIIKRTRFTKYLGINVDETLSFKDHVKSVSKILSRNLGSMRKLKHIPPSKCSMIVILFPDSPLNFVLLVDLAWCFPFDS